MSGIFSVMDTTVIYAINGCVHVILRVYDALVACHRKQNNPAMCQNIPLNFGLF